MSSGAGITEPRLEPLDPDYESAVRASFASQGLMRTLGATLAGIQPGQVTIELAFSDRISQQHGLFHGGVIGTLADNACGYAALSLMPAGSEVLTIEYKINFMKPAKGQLLRATGHVMRAGKSVTVVRADVECIDGGAPAKCALMQATMMRVDAAKS